MQVGQSNRGGFPSINGDSLEVNDDVFVQSYVCPTV